MEKYTKIGVWHKLKKLRLNSFTDKSGKLCWSFYYRDLVKLLKPKISKREKLARERIITSICKFSRNLERKK